MATLQRNHIESNKLGPACQWVVFGFHRSHETFLRTVLAENPHKDVQGLACLSLAEFLNDRLHRLAVLRDQDNLELEERYDRVFGKKYVEELQRQDHAEVALEVETLFARAKDPVDGASPAGSSVAALNLLTLARELDKPEYLKHARGTIESVAAILEASPTATPLMATAVPRLLEGKK